MENDVKALFRDNARDAAVCADAISEYLRSRLDHGGALALPVLLLGNARRALIECSNALGDLLTPGEEVEVPSMTGGTVRVSKKFADAAAAAVAERDRPRKRAGRDVPRAMLRRCLCTHPFSDHNDSGGCFECECEAFETNEVVRPGRDHRHKFGPDNICTVPACGKVKSANGRKPAAPAADAPPVDTRTMALPIPPLGDAAADRFSGGSHGSSGVVRR